MKEYEQMSLYYDSELTGEELDAFERKLFEDSNFAREYEHYAQILERVVQTPFVELPPGLREEIMRRVREEARPIELIGEKTVKERISRRKIGLHLSSFVRGMAESNMRPYTAAVAAVVACVFVIGGLFSLVGTGLVGTRYVEQDVVPMVTYDYGTGNAQWSLRTDTPQTAAMARAADTVSNVFDGGSVVRSAWIVLEVYDIDEAILITNALSGYNERASVQSGRWGNANVDRRVPLHEFDASVNALRSLGLVAAEGEGTRDISLALANAHAQKNALGTEIGRLMRYLELSETLGDMTQISARLGSVEQESHNAQRTILELENLAAMPVINITFRQTEADDAIVPTGFLQEISNSFVGSLRFMQRAFVELGVLFARLLLPSIIIGILAIVFVQVRKVFLKPETAPTKGENNGEK